MSWLKMVQNAAARYLSGVHNVNILLSNVISNYILLMSLNQLPVHYRIEFKALLFDLKSLNDLAPYFKPTLVGWFKVSRVSLV